jgi:alpha-tubulin suppressor-like RCC1 family protein
MEESKGGDVFSFSACRRPTNEITLYSLLKHENTIVGFPGGKRLNFSKRVVGVSAGKAHCLCWDEAGTLFSWGERSIALGY